MPPKPYHSRWQKQKDEEEERRRLMVVACTCTIFNGGKYNTQDSHSKALKQKGSIKHFNKNYYYYKYVLS